MEAKLLVGFQKLLGFYVQVFRGTPTPLMKFQNVAVHSLHVVHAPPLKNKPYAI